MDYFWRLVLLFKVAGLGLLDIKMSDASYLREVCLLPPDDGQSCNGIIPHMQYYFNPDTEGCLPLVYNGCGGNRNRFKTASACVDACQVEWFKMMNKKNGFLDSNEESINSRTVADCRQEKDVGPCRATIPQWFFDKQSGNCLTFNYGGCKGNKNRFNTKQQCQNVCARANIK